MSATRYGGRRVNDVLVTSNIPATQANGGCRNIRRRLRQPASQVTRSCKLRSLETPKPENYEALETSISSRSALASSMRFTIRLLSCTSAPVLGGGTQT